MEKTFKVGDNVRLIEEDRQGILYLKVGCVGKIIEDFTKIGCINLNYRVEFSITKDFSVILPVLKHQISLIP